MKYSPEPAQANTIMCLEIYYAKAGRISLRHTLPYGKRLIPAHLLSVRLDSNGFPGLKARENINGPPSCCDGIVKNIPLRKEAGADPAKKEVCRYDMDLQDHS